jgi:hypothetical protein
MEGGFLGGWNTLSADALEDLAKASVDVRFDTCS